MQRNNAEPDSYALLFVQTNRLTIRYLVYMIHLKIRYPFLALLKCTMMIPERLVVYAVRVLSVFPVYHVHPQEFTNTVYVFN